MEGLDAVLRAATHALAAELAVARRQRGTFGRDCFAALPRRRLASNAKYVPAFRGASRLALDFTSGSVPEQNPVRHRLGTPYAALRALAGERPALGRAATTRLTPWRLTVPGVEQPVMVAVL